VLRVHLWPALRPFVLAVFLSRLPAAILAESTVSFFGIARMEPMSLGRYLGTSYAALIYEGGSRVVIPAWLLLVLLVLGASLASQVLATRTRRA
jgi:peptide/nickel transport system permease protein